MVFMLHVDQLLVQQPHVVIVDQSHGAHNLAVRLLPRFVNKFIANQVAKGFRAICVSAAANEVVELGEQIAIDSHTNPAQAAHAYMDYSGLKHIGGAVDVLRS
jgi:ABC-type Fe3+/spermidine/putrescine transport system ATPase subunit